MIGPFRYTVTNFNVTLMAGWTAGAHLVDRPEKEPSPVAWVKASSTQRCMVGDDARSTNGHGRPKDVTRSAALGGSEGPLRRMESSELVKCKVWLHNNQL